MELCRYAEELKCNKCDVMFYQLCKKFVKQHLGFLCKNIMPFKYIKGIKISGNVYVSRDQDRAKTACLLYAQRLNASVNRISLSQVISLTISNTEVEGRIFYIDASSKIQGDLEKVTGVLRSFIDDVLYKGSVVSVFVGNNSINLSDYTK